jgi:hypothetical protein
MSWLDFINVEIQNDNIVEATKRQSGPENIGAKLMDAYQE